MMNPENALCQVARAATIREPTVGNKYYLVYKDNKFKFTPMTESKVPEIHLGIYTSNQLNDGLSQLEWTRLKIRIAMFIKIRRL